MASTEETVAQLEVAFKDRFTDKDEEYMKVVEKAPVSPPIVTDWGSRYLVLSVL